ncbi:MAG: right-handed parallel beta-helix repeat-containing protein [Planctomycetota bacterium]|nr:right-handed parallel beta-helix repeat-containing protein [Planctomycetota bacterium]
MNVGAAQGGEANAVAYNANNPVYPVSYTEAQKNAQRDAGRAVVKEINAAIAAGAKSFTVPPGVYRLPAKGPDREIKLWKVKGFALHLANTEWALENGGGFIFPQECENISVLGPVKFDADPLCFSQGTVLAHDDNTGLTRVRIMPGYKVDLAPKGTIDAFSPAGIYLANPSWAGYSEARVLDAAQGLIELKTGAREAIYKGLYGPGHLVAMRSGSPLLFSTREVVGLTVKDVDIYTGAGFLWGGGSGDWNFTRILGIPRPGTNRLYGAGGCQVGNFGGNVVFDGCEFSHTADDLMDYYGGGLFMCIRPESPRQVVTWGGTPAVGDTVNFYSHVDFHPIASATVTAAVDPEDPALKAEAGRLIKEVLKARDVGARPVRRLTLDRDVQVAVADFVENGSANRPNQFTIRNCHFHDSGVRVMVQGYKHGLFENNRFKRISGGLALTCDAWWWEGPTCQDIVVRNNVFEETAFRNAWGTGKAAIIIGTSLAPTDPTRGVAFHRVEVVGNTITGSSTAGILISNASDVTVRNNVIDHPFRLAAPEAAIQLQGVDKARLWDNTVIGCPGWNLAAKNANALSIKGNTFKDAYQAPGSPSKSSPSAVISLVGCTNADVEANSITGTDAANGIWVEGSANVHLAGNRAAQMSTPGAVLVGTGSSNTNLRDDDSPGNRTGGRPR